MQRLAIFAKSYQGQLKKGVENSAEYIRPFLYQYGIYTKTDDTIDTEKFDTKEGLLELYEKVADYQKTQNLPFIFGGDHHIAAATVAASIKNYNSDFKLLWIDAHPDLNTMDSSESQNKHGMPIASLMHLMDPWIPNVSKLRPEQIIYFGIRSVDSYEEKIIKNMGIEYYTANDIMSCKLENGDISEIVNNIYRKPIKNLHVSFDVDSLDPTLMPCTGTPVDQGLDVDTIEELIQSVSKKSTVIAHEIVEFNMDLSKSVEDLILSKMVFEKSLEILTASPTSPTH